MNQNDFDFAPRGNRRVQYQQPVQQPAYYNQIPPQPAQPVQSSQGYAPNPGGFAPRAHPGYFTTVNMGDGSQEFRNAYQENLQKFNEANARAKEGISEDDAVANVEKMTEIVNMIEGDTESTATNGYDNINKLYNAISHVSGSIRHPEDWLPVGRESKLDLMKRNGAVVADLLDKFAQHIKTLAVK